MNARVSRRLQKSTFVRTVTFHAIVGSSGSTHARVLSCLKDHMHCGLAVTAVVK